MGKENIMKTRWTIGTIKNERSMQNNRMFTFTWNFTGFSPDHTQYRRSGIPWKINGIPE